MGQTLGPPELSGEGDRGSPGTPRLGCRMAPCYPQSRGGGVAFIPVRLSCTGARERHTFQGPEIARADTRDCRVQPPLGGVGEIGGIGMQPPCLGGLG